MAAHLARDLEQGSRLCMVRDFIVELRGFTGTAKQKLALAENDASRTTLAEFFAGGEPAIAKLLASCKRYSGPVKPERLGLIGRDHLLADCILMGAAERSFRYRKHLGTLATSDQLLPYALEVAFAWCPDGDRRRLITGINFSIATNNPFYRLGVFENIEGALSRQYVQYDDSVILIMHYTCPRVDFSDHGKGMLTLPAPVGRVAAKLVAAVTEDWAKQRRDEMRRESAATKRRERLLQQRERPEKKGPPVPSGTLAERITTAADRHGVSVDDLAVLSPNNDPYTAWRRSRDAECFARLFDRFVAPGAKRHLRGLFYRCVSSKDVIEWPNGKALVNDRKNWLSFQKASKAARWLGFVAFDRIIDARNDEPKIYVPEHEPITTGIYAGETECGIPTEAGDVIPRIFIFGFRGRQTHRIIFYGEKTSLAEILDPIARQIGAEMVLVTGESSDTRLAEAMARASKDGRPAALLYFADFDPSGHQMSISVARKVQALIDFKYPALNIKVYRVALTVEQVREWDLPSKPLSANEKRAAKWRQSFGHEQTEIDAAIELRPDALRDVIVEAIQPFYDDTLDRRVASSEVDWRKQAAEALRGHPDYQNWIRRIEEAYGRAREAIDVLRGAQAQAAEILQGTALPSTPELPEATPPGTAKPALFDSETDFVTATRRLIADKKLIGPDANDDDDDDGGGQ